MTDDLTAEQRLRRELALLRATQAPVIFFEIGSTYGVRNGVANLTLEGGLHITVDGKVVADSQVVGHLRFPLGAIPSLRAALDAIELLAKPAASRDDPPIAH